MNDDDGGDLFAFRVSRLVGGVSWDGRSCRRRERRPRRLDSTRHGGAARGDVARRDWTKGRCCPPGQVSGHG